MSKTKNNRNFKRVELLGSPKKIEPVQATRLVFNEEVLEGLQEAKKEDSPEVSAQELEDNPEVSARELIDGRETAREQKLERLKSARKRIPIVVESSLNDDSETFSRLLLAVSESMEANGSGNPAVNARKLASNVRLSSQLLELFDPEFICDESIDGLAYWQVVLSSVQATLTHIGRQDFCGLSKGALTPKEVESRLVRRFKSKRVTISGEDKFIRIPTYLTTIKPPGKKKELLSSSRFETRRNLDRFFAV